MWNYDNVELFTNFNLFQEYTPGIDISNQVQDVELKLDDKYTEKVSTYPGNNRVLNESIIDDLKIDNKYLGNYTMPESQKESISTQLLIVYGLITGFLIYKV